MEGSNKQHRRSGPSATDPSPTAHLVRGAQAGDEEKFGQLYCRIAPAIYAWARLRIGAAFEGQLDPEDVVQEVWIRAMGRFDDYDAERASFRTWIFGVANRVLLEAFRKITNATRAGTRGKGGPGGVSPDLVADRASSISRQLARDEELGALVSRLQGLDEGDRSLLIYCGLEGRTYHEAAPLLGISTDAVAKRWQRLRSRLRRTTRWDELLEV